MGCRKNLTALTLAERQAFVNALLQLKANGKYDTYVTQHQGAMGHGHGGPAFFPWHREYLLRFERDLQAVDSSVNLPYWDWTVANLNAAGTASLIWSNDFMGGPGAAGTFAVTTGPFAGWGIRRRPFDIFQFPGGGGTIANFMNSLNYSTFRGIEGPHGGAHVWVGGTMSNASIAPQDPTFWLLHTNIDRLWAEWTVAKQGQAGWVQYAPAAGGPQGHNLNDSMWPWNGTQQPVGLLPWTVVPEIRRPADVLDHRALGTFYDTIDQLQCQPIKPKELINEGGRLPKRIRDIGKVRIKDRLPKEIKESTKERTTKEFLPAEKSLKERTPKELKDMREGTKVIREGGKVLRETDVLQPFIREELRPDLSTASLNFEDDIDLMQEELERRAALMRDDWV